MTERLPMQPLHFGQQLRAYRRGGNPAHTVECLVWVLQVWDERRAVCTGFTVYGEHVHFGEIQVIAEGEEPPKSGHWATPIPPSPYQPDMRGHSQAVLNAGASQ